MNPSQRFNLVSQGDPTLLQSRILFDVSEVPVLTSSLNGWAFGSGRFLLGGSCLKVRLGPLTNVRQHSVNKRAGLSLWLPSTSLSHPYELSLVDRVLWATRKTQPNGNPNPLVHLTHPASIRKAAHQHRRLEDSVNCYNALHSRQPSHCP